MSVSTGKFKNYDLGPGTMNIINDRHSLIQDETDKIMKSEKFQSKTELNPQ